jgi:PAS domain S-box-containing protein
MRDEDKAKEQLIYELMELRRRNAELRKSEAQRTKAEEKLRESEEKFRSLAEQSPNMIFINKRGRVVYANMKCQEVMGYRREEFYAPDFDFMGLVSPEYKDTIRASFKSHEGGEEVPPVEYTLLSKEGRRINAILTTKLIRYEGETAILGTVTDITQRKRAEEALQERELRYRNIITQADGVAYQLDWLRQTYTFFDEGIERLTGYTSHEITPEIFESLIEEKIQYTHTSRDTATTSEASHRIGGDKAILYRADYRLRTKDGRTVWAADSSVQLRGFDHKLVGTLGMLQDITDRKRMERKLWESEKRFRELADLLPQTVYETDIEGNLTFVNRYAFASYGYTQEDFDKGLNAIQMLIPEDRARAERNIRRVLAGEEFGGTEYTALRKDGSTCPVIIYATRIIFNGKSLGLRGIIIDITERKQAEKALRESEERYRFLAEKSPLGLSIIGKDGSYKYVNDQFKRMFGYTLEDTPTGREWFRKAYPDEEYRRNVISAWRSDLESAKSSEPRPRMYSVTCKNGEVKEVLFRPVTTETGDEFVLYEDITERVHAERQLKASLREKEVMLREIHHRVKNNLQVISSLLNMSCMQTDNQEAIALLADAQTRVLAMALIHSQLYQTERFDKMDMGILVRNLFAHLANVYATRSRFVTPVILEGTEVFLPITQAIPCSLVLNEVISNIFKHAFKEGKRGTVEISVQNPANSRIHISIKDDGVGIPEDIDIHETHSIGLSLIRTLVQDQLEGTVQINRNNGTEFIMEFPKT